jgi:thioester reductase-like protein
MASTVVLTGASGFIGRELLWRLVRLPDTRVYCLLRAADDRGARSRLEAILDAAQPTPLTLEERSRAIPLRGDLTLERLGLTESQWQGLAEEVCRILHGAAAVAFHISLDESRMINVEGTRQMLLLAKAAMRHRLTRFDYISSCYVAGRQSGLIREEDLAQGQSFNNNYERTKCEAETLVRAHANDVPICIFRPPMVVGDSRTGYAATFKVLYWPLKMLSRGYVWVVPGDATGVVDVVPVDFVCDALEFISADSSQRGKCFHLAAGPEHSTTVGQCIDLAVAAFGVRRPLLMNPAVFRSLVRPLLKLVLWGRRRELLTKGRVYTPYISYRAQFDTSQVRVALSNSGLEVFPVERYFRKVVEYAVETDWGKRLQGSAHAHNAV